MISYHLGGKIPLLRKMRCQSDEHPPEARICVMLQTIKWGRVCLVHAGFLSHKSWGMCCEGNMNIGWTADWKCQPICAPVFCCKYYKLAGGAGQWRHEWYFYMPIFRRDILWYDDVHPSVSQWCMQKIFARIISLWDTRYIIETHLQALLKTSTAAHLICTSWPNVNDGPYLPCWPGAFCNIGYPYRMHL